MISKEFIRDDSKLYDNFVRKCVLKGHLDYDK